jgi:pimeloyl-ACP methyl ester carboxylesterase
VSLLPAQHEWTAVPEQAPFKEGLAKVNDTKLYYRDTGGKGPVVVLMHPLTGSAMIWGYQQPVLAAAGFRVIAFSRRGHAKSDPGVEGKLGTLVDDLDALMDHLKVKRFHVVGSAAGGYFIPDYALSSGDRLLSMTMACSIGGIIEPSLQEKLKRMTVPGYQALPASFRELGPSYRAANPEGRKAWEDLEHASLSGPKIVLQPLKNKTTYAELVKIKTPVLVMAGGSDGYAPPTVMMDIAANLPNAEFAILSESGHSGYWEQPIAFNNAIIEYMKKNTPA